MNKILISAGDYSADLHGKALSLALREKNPSLEITALGGIKLKEVATPFLEDMVGLDISGFSKPIRQFFNLRRILKNKVFPLLENKKVEAVVLIDYYGFNIHIAKKAYANNIPVFYFVSPQVWASRSFRIKKIKKYVTKMLVIFPFEEELYKKNGVDVTFIGHPFIDKVPNKIPFRPYNKEKPFDIVLLPGSRERELRRHIPLMVQTFIELKKKFPNLRGKLITVDSLGERLYADGLKSSSMTPQALELVGDPNFEHRLKAGFALTASGTATLENALLGLPMVVIYQTSWLTYTIAKQIIRVPYISMPNILMGKKFIPELVQKEANFKSLVATCVPFFNTPSLLETMHEELIKLKKALGPPGSYERAAAIILNKGILPN